MAKKPVKVTKETDTGRNEKFHDTSKNTSMTRSQFVKKIEKGDYPGYHVRKVGGIKTPASNPDGKKGNNLG